MLAVEDEAVTKRGRGRPRKIRPETGGVTIPSVPATAELTFTESDRQELLRLKARDEYKASFYAFFLAAFPHIQDQVFAETWFPQALCAELQAAGLSLAQQQEREFHLNVNVPPRSLKSVIISVCFPVWLWLHKPNAELLTVSHNAEMAKKLLRFSKNILESDWFIYHFPEFHPEKFIKYTETEITNPFKGSRKAFGVGADILGANANLIICDDIMDADTALSDTERGKVIYKVTNSVFGRLNNKQIDLIINVQQRLHIEDLTGYVLANMAEFWRSIKLPSEAKSPDDVIPTDWFYRYDTEYNERGEVVGKLLANLKGKLSRKDLEFEKKRIGTLAYSQQHLQSPRAAEGGMYKTKWFDNQKITLEEFEARTRGHHLEWQLFIDGAQTDNPERDPTCLLLCCKCDNQLYIRQVQNVHKRITDLVKFINDYLESLANRFIRVARALVEDKSIGLDLIDIMRRSAQRVPFVALSTNNDPKYVRAHRAVPFVEAGKLWLIQGEAGIPSWIREFIDQVTGFTNGKGSKHDDAVDTMAYAIANAQVSEVWSG